ncbi:MAG: LTA synthase family protein [Chitinispirillaceae bacterium]|nr:LTA synthase family protein [Chitinispirillaceae bacterium]
MYYLLSIKKWANPSGRRASDSIAWSLGVHALWLLFFTLAWWGPRYAISRSIGPAGVDPLLESMRVTAIDAPIIVCLALFGTAAWGKSRFRMFLRLLLLTTSIAVLLLNASNLFVAEELYHLLSRNELGYAADLSFLIGSGTGAVFSFQGLLFVLVPVFVFILLFICCKKRREGTRLVLVVLLAALWLLPVAALRRYGYRNPTPRIFASSQSLYFHSLLKAAPRYKPLKTEEIAALKTLRDSLFFISGEDMEKVADNGSPPNIILIVFESFRNAEIDSAIKGVPIAGNLKNAEKEGRRYRNFYSNGYMTSRALWSMYTGELGGSGWLIFYEAPSFKTEFISEELHRIGYRNYWFHGNTASFDNRKDILPYHAFDKLFDRDEFPADIPREGWGIWDEDFFRYGFYALDSLSRVHQPFFATFLTLSNHHPYKMQEKFQVFNESVDPKKAPYLNGLHYSDYAFGVFWDSLKTRGWYNNTYLLITADNGNKPIDPVADIGQEIQHFFHVPFFIIGLGITGGEQDTLLGSHIDIAPTILDLAGAPSQRTIGTSLLAPSRRAWLPIVGTFFGDIVLKKDVLLIKDKNKAIQTLGELAAEGDILLLNQFSNYQELWSRMIYNGQEDNLQR